MKAAFQPDPYPKLSKSHQALHAALITIHPMDYIQPALAAGKPVDHLREHFVGWVDAVVQTARNHATIQLLPSLMENEFGATAEEMKGLLPPEILTAEKAKFLQAETLAQARRLLVTTNHLEEMVKNGNADVGLTSNVKPQLLGLIKTFRQELYAAIPGLPPPRAER